MPTRDWSVLDWTPNLTFALPTEYQLARSSIPDSGKGAETKFAPNAQNLALLRSLGYGGADFSYAPESDYGFGSQPMWSDEARTWLANNGYSVGVAHDPGTSPGGRPEYYGLTGPDGKWVGGQSDPTMIQTDTLMDQVTPFLMMAGPFASAISTAEGLAAAGAGAGVGAGAGTGALTAADSGLTSLASQGLSPQALGLTGGITPSVTASELAALSSSLPGAVDATSALASTGSSLVPQAGKGIWDMVQSGALKGAATGGIKGLVTGQNPFQSALKGAVSGAIGGGVSSIGQGALGNLMSGLDGNSGGMNLIQNAFDAPIGTDAILNNVGSFADAPGGFTPNMGGLDMGSLWGADPSGGFVSALPGFGSFSDPPSAWDWGSVDLGGYGGPTDSGGDYSHEGMNYSGPGGLDPVTNSPVNSGSDSGWLQNVLGGLKGAVGGAASAVGGDKILAGLVGAGIGAASGGGSQTKTNEPWQPAQQYLKDVLGDAGNMRASMAANPYTPQQTAAYGNAFAGLDQARAALPGLLGWSQSAMQRQSTTPSYAQLFGGAQPAQQPTAQAGGVGGLLGDALSAKNMMVRGRGLIG